MARPSGISPFMRNKFLVALIISTLILCIVFFISYEYFPFTRTSNFTGVLVKTANLGIRDVLLSRFSTNPIANKNIAIVAIDNKSLSDTVGLGRFQDYKRSYYARVIDHLKRDGAIVIGIDVLFSETSSDDEELEASIRSAGNVVLGFSLTESLFPIDRFSEHALGMGYFHPKINPHNTSVYGIAPAKIRGDTVWESFSFALMRRYLDVLHGTKSVPEKTSTVDYGGLDSYLLRDLPIPYASDGSDEVYINYLPRSSRFETLSFTDVYHDTYDRSKVANRIVLIGSTAAALFDRFNTPLGIQDGVYVHANMLNTILNKAFLVEVGEGREILLLILIAFFLTLFTLHVDNRVYQLLFAVIGLVLFLFWEYIYFRLFHKLFRYPMELLMIVFFVATSVTGYKYLYEEKGKRLLRNTLSQYLAEDLVLSVLENYEEVRLGGVRREITTFFSDIAGFTTLSENMEPEEIVRFLSTYLKEVSDVIMHEHGFINKYEWDAVMAIWGAFWSEPRQAYLACRSALAQQRKIRELNAHFEQEHGFSIRVRMGINKWIAVVGNIGSEGKKIEYTALGDSVNTASRFEGINKLYGTDICVGASIAEEVRDIFAVRKLDHIQVKGKGKPLYIYELVGAREDVSAEKLEIILEYERAFTLYESQQFESAQAIFARLAERGDAPSKALLKRTQSLVGNPFDPEWTGIFQAREK